MKLTKYTVLIILTLLLSACAEAPRKIEVVFYPPPPETPRIQFLTSISKETDLGKKNEFRTFLIGEEQETKQMARPYAIAHQKGQIFIADKTIKKVLIVDLDNNSFDYIRDIKGGALQDPAGIYMTSDGYKYVADANRGQIVVYNDKNEFYRAYGAEGQFHPTDVVVFENRIYVCDIEGHEIEVLDKETGDVIDTIGGPGAEEGSFRTPSHLAIDTKGNLYVTDALNFRIQMFDKDGNFLRVIGAQGTYPGTFARPKGLAVDHDGHLYSADSAFEIIQIFDVESAEPLLPFGKYGPAPGSTYLPSSVHIDYDNISYFNKYIDRDFKVKYLIYVGNMLGDHKINVYGYGDWVGASLKGNVQPAPEQTGEVKETVPTLDDIEP